MRRVVIGALLLLAAPLAAQRQESGPWPWERGAWWHVTLDAATDTDRARLEAARAELALGRPRQARALLTDIAADSPLRAPALAMDAEALAALDRPAEAAARFETAAGLADSATAGTLLARAGASWAAAEERARARAAFVAAADRLPIIAGWLRLRAAAAGDDPDAPALTTDVPPAAQAVARAARAELLVRLGDTARAVDALIAADRRAAAARLELATGDTVAARALAYAALGSVDTAEVGSADRLISQRFEPIRADEYLSLARAAERLRDNPQAAHWTSEAVRAGDTSAATAALLGDRLDRAGDRRAAVRAYEWGGATGTFRAARLLVRLREVSAARTALTRFVAEHPDHADAPVAAFLLADLAGDRAALAAVAERWPTHEVATRVRLDLAARALSARDTATARRWYTAEVRHAREAPEAAYLLARLDRAAGDTTWRETMRTLAARDPLGFYGLMAREAAGLPWPDFTLPSPAAPDPAVALVLDQLDALDAAGFTAEADLLVAEATERLTATRANALTLAEGLIARERTPEAIAIGWRTARGTPLTDPRLARVLFPWPERDLVLAEARKFDLDPWLVAGLIRQESSFRTRAISRAGATGLMQLMPATAREVARRQGVPWTDTHRAVPDANVHVGAAHLAALIQTFNGEIPVALAAYNAGGTPTRRWRRAAGSADPVAFVESITYPETRGYVRAVLRNAALYRALYPEP